MTSKKPKFDRKIWSEGHLLLSLFINRSLTKKFPTKRILKTVDSSVRNLGKVEYDKQNWLQHQQSQIRPKNSKWGLPPLPMNINRFITKYFPIETIRERTYSSIKTLGKSKRMSRTGYNIMLQSCVQGGSNGFSVLSHDSQLMAEHGFLDIVGKFKCPIRLPQGFLH